MKRLSIILFLLCSVGIHFVSIAQTPSASELFQQANTLYSEGEYVQAEQIYQNLLADHTNYLISYIVPIAGLLFILFYALVGSKNVNTDIPTE